MLETGFAQLRFAASLVFGTRLSLRSLDRLISSLQETRREFGVLSAEGRDLLAGPTLDEESRRTIQLRRFRSQAVRAARETVYYQRLFERLALDPARLRYGDIAALPLTPKADLRADPDAFVCRSATPFLRALTTGTTGWPTNVSFSSYEMRVYFALAAISALFRGELEPEDIVQISTSSRGTLGNVCLAGACAHLGATVYLAGVTEPSLALGLLAQTHAMAGKKSQTSVLYTYPSYLGELVECGLSMNYRPSDFGLERIFVGGEVVTDGLKARSQQLFGSARVLEGGYGMTELWPLSGQFCEAGHLHFEISQGLVEVYNGETAAPALPGEAGTIVATPFFPYRETTLLLRYNTEDVVQQLAEAPTCTQRHLPATSPLLGKQALSVRHEQGWTYPRQVAEALEVLEEVPLPARYGFWAVPGGVAVEVVVRQVTQQAHSRIETSLLERGVPVQDLHLREERGQLQHPIPLRGDLREHTFSPPLTRERSSSDEASHLHPSSQETITGGF
jgi:phenylacetate-coenzyme A ligase PaaK-like adenylate-forming protein